MKRKMWSDPDFRAVPAYPSRYEVWGYREHGETVVTRYSLAYINHAIFQGDNGRVLGFDTAHGYHHRHFMGNVEAVDFVSHEATQERFQQEWLEVVNQARGNKSWQGS